MSTTTQSETAGRKLGLDPAVAFGLAGALIFFVLSGLVAYFNLQALREGNDRVVQTHVAIVSLDELLSLVQDGETGQRGFLLTNNESYLAPYNTAVQRIPAKLDEIGQRTGGNAGQGQRLTALRQHVEAKLSELAGTIDIRRTQGLDAAVARINSDRGKIEMDAIRAQIAAMAEGESDVRIQRLAEMSSAQRTAFVSTLLSGFLGILLTATIGFLIRRATLARRRDQWLQSGHLGLATAMMGDQPVEQLGNSILDFLTRYVGAVAGAVFTGGGQNFQRASVYGVPDGASVPARFKPREGLLGQAAVEGKPIVVDDVPDGYLAFGSALGKDKPKHLVILPGSVDGVVNSVVELGFLRPIDERVVALLDRRRGSSRDRGPLGGLSRRAAEPPGRNPAAVGGTAVPRADAWPQRFRARRVDARQ